MSAWDDRYGTGPAVAGTGGSRQYGPGGVGLPGSGVGSVYHPTPSGTDTGAGGGPEESSTPGVVSINPLDPAGTAKAAGGPIQGLFDGLRQALVGGNEDQNQQKSSVLGGIPLLGDAGRAIADAGGVVGDLAANFVGGAEVAAEHLPSNTLPGTADTSQALDKQYSAIPADFRQKYDDAIQKEHGLFGTGLLDDDAHWKSAAVRAYAQDQQYEHPTLAPGAFTPPGSLADSIGMLFDALGVSATVAAKGWAQLDTPGQGGMDRIDIINAVGKSEDEGGNFRFAEDKGLLGTGLLAGDPTSGLNQMERLVYEKMKAGDWTRDDAANFLASEGQAFGHSAIANIGGGLALDPLNVATFGAGAVAKFGASGLVMATRFEQATAKLAEVAKALEEAKAAEAAATGARDIKVAKAATEAAQATFDTARASVESLAAYHSGGAIRGANVVARAVEGSEKVGTAFRAAGELYGMLDGTNLGRVAKVARTIIDPLHAVDMGMPGASRLADVYNDAVPAEVVKTLGVHHYKGILDDLLRLDNSRGLYDQFTNDIGSFSANFAREGVTELFRAGQVAGGLGEELMKVLPDDVFETAVKSTKQRDLNKWLRYNTLAKVQVDKWDDAAHLTLARGLEQTYGIRSADEWLEAMKGMSKEQKSLYKAAVYGHTNKALLDFVDNMADDVAAKLPVPKGRMVLLAKGTLTRLGGESLLTKLSGNMSLNKKLQLIRDWQEQYPSLRYITIDPANRPGSVDAFVQYLEDNMDRLPMQLKEKELADLGDDGDLLKSITGEYSIGFRPDDQFLWGLERENGTGLYRAATAPWVDHVALDSAISYRPARALRVNIAGHPLVDVPVVRAAVRAVDHMDSAARLMKSQVTSAMVTEAARKKFIARASSGELAEHGVTEQVAHDWFERINQYVREHQGYSGPRGMGGEDLYKDLRRKNLIPQPLLNGERQLQPDDIMRLVLDAYDGDMRYIGLTQKLSGRAKKMLFETTGSNWAGQIAEHAWPTLKFRYNPIFQLQEKVEPWVLNAQRGVSFATGVNMSEADRATERLLQTMTDNSLVRQADLDQFEYSSQVLFGGVMGKKAATPGSKLNRIQSMAQSLTEVQGMKRVNMLRTFRKGLGKEMKDAWEQARPGEWDQMKAAADIRAGRILDEDDFALQVMSEQAYSNDILVHRIEGTAGMYGLKADWSNAIKTGAWHTPTTLGELKALDLDHVAESLKLTNRAGADIKDLTSLRQALATEPDMLGKVRDGLTRLGADPDYIRRVENGLNFSWNGFWKTAEKRFSLTPEESRSLQDMMSASAQVRGMTPVEFMSQVFSPSLIDGEEGVLGYLEGPTRILREARAAGRKVKAKDAKLMESRTQLAGKEGVSTREDLVRQMSRAFSAHLDPSARRALLMEFKPELGDAVRKGAVQLDLEEVESLWDDLAENELADRILGYMDGVPGTGAHKVVTDEARGVASVREGAANYMKQRGVTPLEERRYYDVDQPFYEDSARAYSELPSTPYDRTGRIPNAGQVHKSTTELKPQPAGVDDRTYNAYRDMVADTRAQWDHMTAPKSKGGMGIKVIVSKTDPYPDSAAMRADVAKGQLRVLGANSDHPLMTNEQNVMFRAVHDVFGHAAEGFEFGPQGELNAAIKHSQMYSDTGRAAMLTETHGQTSWVNFSDDVVPENVGNPPLDPADLTGDYMTRHPSPYESEDYTFDGIGFGYNDFDMANTDFSYPAPLPLGQGILDMDESLSEPILQHFSDLQAQFPDYNLQHLDVPFDMHEPVEDGGLGLDIHTQGATYGGDGSEPIIALSPRLFGPDANEVMAAGREKFERSRGATSFNGTPRKSAPGTPFNAMYGPTHVMNHEYGHVVLGRIRFGFGSRVLPEHKEVNEFLDEFLASGDQKYLSEYAMRGGDEAEITADLFSVMMASPEMRAEFKVHPKVQEWADKLKQKLIDTGNMKETAPNPLAGKTVRELNAAKRGTVYAEQKAALLPQDILDRFGEQFVGKGKHVESNPDVARTAQMFGKWTDAVINNGLLRGDQAVHAGLLNDIAGIPTKAATPYNFSEAAMMNLATQNMVRKWDDAFRLQYFAQERSFLERSLNHPMFGMYPASYMWGKIAPEMVRFLAFQPFGNKTGGLLRSAMDVQASIALRREYDAEFDAKIEELGHSQALSFLGYLLPTLPWDISASAPGWMRSLAQQGEDGEARAAKGQQPKGVSLLAPATDVFERLVPLTTTLPWAGRALDELNGQTDKEAALDVAQHDKLVQASELQPTLQRVMQELQEALR